MVEWEKITIGELLDFKNGLNKAKDFFGSGTPIVNYMDVYKHRGINAKQLVGRVTLTQEELKRYDVRKGDVFFTRTSETPEEVGYASVMLDDIDDCVFSGFVLRGRPKTEKLDLLYCKYGFMTEEVRKAVMSGCSYTTRALTNGTQLSAIEIKLPPKSEQHPIAEALSDMDSCIVSLEKLIGKKRAIKQGTMQELLTGKRRLPGFDGEWVRKPLLDCCDLLQGLTYSPNNVQSFGLLVLRSSNIKNSKLTFDDCVYVDCNVEENKYVKTNDILICVRNGSSSLIGKSCVIDQNYNATFGAFMSVLRGDDTGYIAHIFSSDIVQEQIRSRSSATINQITKRDFEDIVIPIPPTLAEQIAIAQILSDMDAEIDTLTAKLTKLKNIKQGMMNELLTGRIRLKEDAQSGKN